MRPLIKTDNRLLKVGILMSGSGTNAEKIIEYQEKNPVCNYQVVVIFTDNPRSRAKEIGREHSIPMEILDIKEFFKKHPKLKRYNLEDRPEYDREVVKLLKPYKIDLLAYAGFMNITTKPIIESFLGINVHPADLSIKDSQGKRKFIGEQAVRDAIETGEKTIGSTTHLITAGVDQGPILMISKRLKVKGPKELSLEKDLDKIADFNQERLKKAGDWVIFPKSIESIAQGEITQDQKGRLFFQKKEIPDGIRL